MLTPQFYANKKGLYNITGKVIRQCKIENEIYGGILQVNLRSAFKTFHGPRIGEMALIEHSNEAWEVTQAK